MRGYHERRDCICGCSLRVSTTQAGKATEVAAVFDEMHVGDGHAPCSPREAARARGDCVTATMRRDSTSETTRRRGLWRRMRLRRADGRVYLDRWGFAHERIGRVLIHRMDAPDPGLDLHDHPWAFVSVVLWGGYTEQRALCREAPQLARLAERWPGCTRGVVERRRPGSVRVMRLDECHTITELHRGKCWTLVIGGPRRRQWGFYLPEGYVDERTYDLTIRTQRRDMWNELGASGPRPW